MCHRNLDGINNMFISINIIIIIFDLIFDADFKNRRHNYRITLAFKLKQNTSSQWPVMNLLIIPNSCVHLVVLI